MPRNPLPVGAHGRITSQRVNETTWAARTRYRDADGIVRKVEARRRSREAAERALQASLAKRVTPTGGDVHPATKLSDLAERWFLEEIAASDRKAANTKLRYRQVIDKYVTPGVGGLRVREVTTGTISRYLKKVEREVGATTARTVRSVLSGMFQFAVISEACDRNPVRDVARIAVESKEVRAMTLADVTALRAAVRADQAAVSIDLPELLDVLLATGCRIGEALALRWDDVHLEKSTISIAATVVRVPGVGLKRQEHTKGREKKPRVLRLPESAVEMLRTRKATVAGGDLNLVFPSAKYTMREVTTVDRQWREFRKRNPAFEWVNLHVVRKTVATTIERANGLGAASEVLGHTSTTMTTKHYVEAAPTAPDVSETLQVLLESGEFAVNPAVEAAHPEERNGP